MVRSTTSRRERTARAVTEAWRVLAPGGRLVIADIKTTRLYASTLAALGAAAVTHRRLGWRFWWGNPFAATKLVTASKSSNAP
jgi:arsenite methyltransferase